MNKSYSWYILAAVIVMFILIYVFSRQVAQPPQPAPQNGNSQVQQREVNVYFTNSVFDPEFTCTNVFPVKRYVAVDAEPIRAAVEELLKGPTAAENMQSYQTSLNPNTRLQSVTITDTKIQLDFDKQLDFEVGGSCRVAAIWSQIAETAKQFAPNKEIVLSIDGRTEDILQP